MIHTEDKFGYYIEQHNIKKCEKEYESAKKSLVILLSEIDRINDMLSDRNDTIEYRLQEYEEYYDSLHNYKQNYLKKAYKLREKIRDKNFKLMLDGNEKMIAERLVKLKNKYKNLKMNYENKWEKIPKQKTEGKSKPTHRTYNDIPPIILKQKRKDMIEKLENVINEYEKLKSKKTLEPQDTIFGRHYSEPTRYYKKYKIDENAPITSKITPSGKGSKPKYDKDVIKERRESINRQKYGAILETLKDIEAESYDYNMYNEELSDGRDFIKTLKQYREILENKFEVGKFTHRKQKKSTKPKTKAKTTRRSVQKQKTPTKKIFKNIKIDDRKNVVNNLKKFKIPKIKL